MKDAPSTCACPHSGACPMFDLFRRSGTLALWQGAFCDGDYKGCARFKLSLEGRKVPPTLLPNGRDLGAAKP